MRQILSGDLDHLTSEVHGDRLVLGTTGSVGHLGEVRYDVLLSEVRTVEVPGSGSIRAGRQSVVVDGSGSVEERWAGSAGMGGWPASRS